MDDFINRVIDTWGEAGEVWLDELPELIEKSALIWGLSDIQAYPDLSYNFVAHAKQNDKTVTLKLSKDKSFITDEYNALTYFSGNGVIKVFDINHDTNALLLEEAVPGSSLKNLDTPKIIDKISIYADVVNKIAATPSNNLENFTHVKKWCAALNETSSNSIPQKFVDTAQKLQESLLSSAENEYLCHADLHLDNIIQNTNNWLAIDPKGVIAEKAFEVAAFDLLTDEELANGVNLSKRIVARNHSLATTFNIEPQRLLSWFFLRLIISAQWFIDDNADPSKPLNIAQYIHPLLK